MYPSGSWRGFWHQEGYGRQSMAAFRLTFADGKVSGGGTDIVGRFVVAGRYDERTGVVTLLKQYVGKHRVEYQGEPDGEGNIAGRWTVRDRYFGTEFVTTGPFLMKPALPAATGDEPIHPLW